MYTLKEAAEATGRGKPAILKSIQKGRISAQKNLLGEWQIDPAELHRVYPPVSTGSSKGNCGEHRETPEINPKEVLRLEMELALKEEQIRSLEREVRMLESAKEDLKEDRDNWRKQAQQVTVLLTHQREQGKLEVIPETNTSTLWQKLSIFFR